MTSIPSAPTSARDEHAVPAGLSPDRGNCPSAVPALLLGALFAAGLTMSLSGCAATRGLASEQPRLGPGDLVRLVPQDDGSTPNDHPVRISARDLHLALGALRKEPGRAPTLEEARAGNEGSDSAVFLEPDLKQASAALELAFAQATPQQDVALRLSQLRSGGLVGFLRTSRVTAARLFYRDRRLHVIFGAVDLDAQREAAIKGDVVPKTARSTDVSSTMHFAREIGSRTRPRHLDWDPLLPPGARLHSDGRNDWIDIDMDALVGAATTPAPGAGLIDDAMSQEPTRTRTSAAAIEQRLRELRSFLDQGLISEELYREKVRELVDRLIESPAR